MKVQPADTNREMALRAVRRKWMVVDDNETILRMTTEMLVMFTDAEICCFQSPAEAVRAFEADPSAFELVVTDFDMPEMNGAELCQQLRLNALGVKIILTTGSANISGAKALSLGFDAFLAKPFPVSALTSVLEGVQRANALRAA